MKLKSVLTMLAVVCFVAANAQTADEIINKYFENTGGKAKWEAVKAVKKTAKVVFGGNEIPVINIQLKDGRQFTSYTFQGMEFKQGVFDGTSLWGINQMTMKAEKSDAETTENFKAALDFLSPFLDYQKKGYKVELVGKETVEGTETFKIKLTKKPMKVDGKETENVEYHFFDTENFVPLLVETEVKAGPGKGMIGQNKMSDYQEVNGLMFAFSSTGGAKGQPGGQTITYTAIEIDPKIDESIFKFPEEKK